MAIGLKPLTVPPRMRISDAISEHLQRLLREGVLHAGEALPSERDMAAALNVSRASLREALKHMETSGLITQRGRGGFVVANVAEGKLVDPLHALASGQSALDTCLQVLELRHGLEAVSAYFAAVRATAADKRRLKSLYRALGEAKTRADEDAHAELDADFHVAIADAAHNAVLSHAMRSMIDVLKATLAESHHIIAGQPRDLERIHAQHGDMLTAILDGDAVRAQAAAHTHLQNVAEILQRAQPIKTKRRVSHGA